MTLQTVEITEQFGDGSGPLANVLVTAELVAPGQTRAGVTGPQVFSARTDADGELVLDVWPNTAGMTNTWYVFNAWHPNTGDKILDNVRGVVPGYSVTLSDILSRNPNPVARAVNAAESTLTAGGYRAALDVVVGMAESYSKRVMLARLAVVNLQIWPYSAQKLVAAESATALLAAGATRTELETQIDEFSPFVDAYSAATQAAHSHSQADKNVAQAALNAAPYGESFDTARNNVQALIESTVTTARFASLPLLSDLGDVSELIAGAHPFLSADGLAVRNPGQNVFAFVGDQSVLPGSGWHVVEFDIADGYALESFVGVGDLAAINQAVAGSFGAGAVFAGFDVR